MSAYSISQLEKLTGIKAHTIRIWEQRYNLLKPHRTDSNIRLYNDDQLKKLLNASLLLSSGHKISKIASYSEREVSGIINEMIVKEASADFTSEAIINQLITSGLTYNEILFEKNFASALIRFGVKDTYVKVLYPMLSRLGILWSASEVSLCQEHFISNLVRQKLFVSIDSLPLPSTPQRKWILFLPEEEDHEIGLLFANFLLKQACHNVIYLGSRVPFENLKEAIRINKPTNLLFFIVRHQQKFVIQKLVRDLEKNNKNISLVVAGNSNALSGIKKNKKTNFVNSIEQFQNVI